MFENIHLFIGYFAAVLTTGSFLPQAIKTIKTRETSGISLVMYSLFSLGVLLWLIYGLLVKDYIIVLANLITLVFALIILIICLLNLKKNRKNIK